MEGNFDEFTSSSFYVGDLIVTEPLQKRAKTCTCIAKTGSTGLCTCRICGDENSSDSNAESEEWQVVEDKTTGSLGCESATPTLCQRGGLHEDNVEISIDVPGTSSGNENRDKYKFDWAKYVQWQVNRYNKSFQQQTHKAHLVCLIASALYHNTMCNSVELQARALSQVPIHLVPEISTTDTFDLGWLANIIKWLKASYRVTKSASGESAMSVTVGLSHCIEEKSTSQERDHIHVCLITLRALGIQARLVQSLQPITLKYSMLSKVLSRQTSQRKPSDKGELYQETVKPRRSVKYKTNKQMINSGGSRPKKKGASILHDGNKELNSPMLMLTEMSSDSDFEPDVKAKGPPKSRKATNRKILSSDSEDDCNRDILSSKRMGSNDWIEVYNPSENNWICVDCVRGHINRPDLCEQHATKPMCYVVAVDNENCVKDVTKRYASMWLFMTEKLRVIGWWEDTLKPFCTKLINRNKQEDAQLQRQLEEKPLPTSISEYKNHQLYVLKRHLLKFEALYPESATILGYCRGEAVYSRACVRTLHTKQTWLKEGLMIQHGEEPYKIVKARPKKNKYSSPQLPLYGKWQTQLYIPPSAVDGKVPRNEYGNVELFQPSMLPVGTVHLQIPGLHITARKLGVDCVPAVVGWDFHGGSCHPVLDGYVVCKEFQDILLDMWEKDQIDKEQKLKQKKEMQVVKNWKMLVTGVLIRERLEQRFQRPPSQNTT